MKKNRRRNETFDLGGRGEGRLRVVSKLWRMNRKGKQRDFHCGGVLVKERPGV